MQIILFVIFGIINAVIAGKKGYNALIWFFAAGLLGLIVLLILPNSKMAEAEECERLRKRGNNIGLGILGAVVILMVIFIIALSS